MATDAEPDVHATQAELDLEVRDRENQLLQVQLKQLQEASYAANTTPRGQADLAAMLAGAQVASSGAPQAPQPSSANSWPESLGDCGKEFQADMCALPAHQPPSALDIERLTQLHTFFAAAPFTDKYRR